MAKVLLIEDDEDVRAMLRLTLQRAGHAVVEAANGNEGLAHFRRESADVIVTDLIMPEKDGLETIIQLKRDHPDVKIIAMSAGGRISSQDYLKVAKNLGAVHVLTKPFPSDVLLQAIAGLQRPSP